MKLVLMSHVRQEIARNAPDAAAANAGVILSGLRAASAGYNGQPCVAAARQAPDTSHIEWGGAGPDRGVGKGRRGLGSRR